MRTTVTIDDALYAQAVSLADTEIEKTELFREAIQTYIRVQTAKRLAALGGSMPTMENVPRHRSTQGNHA